MNATKNMQFLRTHNRAAIIKALALKEASSRLDLTSCLGLSKMAISGLVNDLINDGYIEDRKYSPFKDSTWYTGDTSGRKPSVLSIPPRKINTIGLHIKRYEVHCLIAEIQGAIIYHDFRQLPADADNQYFIKLITDMIEKAINSHKDCYFAGIGIASIGPLDIYQKRILLPPNFCNIGNVPIGELLEDRFGLPVYLDNDMNASAIGEQFFGARKNIDNLVYVGFGTGVGAGVILHGRLLHGSGGFAGEIGHISIDPNGPLCSCGQHGCVELYTNVSRLLKNTGAESIDRLSFGIHENSLSPQNQQYILDCKNAVKNLLVTIANLYDPEIIIFGELPKPIAFIYLDDMENHMNHHMFHHGFQNIRLYPSSFGENAPLIGSAALVFQRIFTGELPLPENN